MDVKIDSFFCHFLSPSRVVPTSFFFNNYGSHPWPFEGLEYNSIFINLFLLFLSIGDK